MNEHRMIEITRVLPQTVRESILAEGFAFEKLQEVRMRVNQAVSLLYDNREVRLGRCVVSGESLRETLELVSSYSMYAYEEDIRQGFITIPGGHRVGLSGKVVLENQRVKTMKYISFMNIRVAHQIRGCAEEVFRFVHEKDRLMHTLIISPPGCGKTTMLRDLIRLISNGNSYYAGVNVGVVDERSEIAACYHGRPQNDVGSRTDVLDCCPKAQGMLMLLRSMSPQVIAVDEIGAEGDIAAMKYVINSGCTILGTVHGASVEEIQAKPMLGPMLQEGIFQRAITLSHRDGVGTISERIHLS